MLAVGFEKMAPGSLEASQGHDGTDRALSVEKHIQVMADTYGFQAAPITSQMFGNAGKEHMEKYGNFFFITFFQYKFFRNEAGTFCKNCLQKSFAFDK